MVIFHYGASLPVQLHQCASQTVMCVLLMVYVDIESNSWYWGIEDGRGAGLEGLLRTSKNVRLFKRHFQMYRQTNSETKGRWKDRQTDLKKADKIGSRMSLTQIKSLHVSNKVLVVLPFITVCPGNVGDRECLRVTTAVKERDKLWYEGSTGLTLTMVASELLEAIQQFCVSLQWWTRVVWMTCNWYLSPEGSLSLRSSYAFTSVQRPSAPPDGRDEREAVGKIVLQYQHRSVIHSTSFIM